jgi:hypothetical protein
MTRMLLIGYCMGIRPERRLCEKVHLNLAYRWFCRLDLTSPVPGHSTFSKNRHGRFRNSDLFRHLFESVVARCIAAGLVGGERFAVDASLIQADANRQNSTAKDEWDAGAIDPATAPRAMSPGRVPGPCASILRSSRPLAARIKRKHQSVAETVFAERH